MQFSMYDSVFTHWKENNISICLFKFLMVKSFSILRLELWCNNFCLSLVETSLTNNKYLLIFVVSGVCERLFFGHLRAKVKHFQWLRPWDGEGSSVQAPEKIKDFHVASVRFCSVCRCSTHRHHELTHQGCALKFRQKTNFARNLLRNLPRKEVIQPHLPVRLPCYDFTPVTNPALGRCFQKVSSRTSGVVDFHGVTGGVYKTRERIQRSVLICVY